MKKLWDILNFRKSANDEETGVSQTKGQASEEKRKKLTREEKDEIIHKNLEAASRLVEDKSQKDLAWTPKHIFKLALLLGFIATVVLIIILLAVLV